MTDEQLSPVRQGDVLAGKYRVERVLGAGGMGVVVAARHIELDQLVALKFMTKRSAAADERFAREAKAAAKIKSEHAAKVHDVGKLEDGAPYLVMEYLEGCDLSALLEAQGALPVDLAVAYVLQACEAIGEAHALGIVHRDLKPHNLFLTGATGATGTTGTSGKHKIKVLDFGISKTQDGDVGLTRSNEMVGTPVYMAPEQLRSAKDVDARADIWALGAMLYELVTGRLPFEAENVAHLCTLVLSEPPKPPRVHRADIPPGLNDVILRCLLRDPAARFQSVAELATALEPFAAGWASIDRARWVPSVLPSGRAIVSSPSNPSGKTSAAWSETELAPAPPAPVARWRVPAGVAVGLTLAAIGVMFAVARTQAGPAPTDSLVGVAPARPSSSLPAMVVLAPGPTAPPEAVPPPVEAQVAAMPSATSATSVVVATRAAPSAMAAKPGARVPATPPRAEKKPAPKPAPKPEDDFEKEAQTR